jgi:TonB family protein
MLRTCFAIARMPLSSTFILATLFFCFGRGQQEAPQPEALYAEKLRSLAGQVIQKANKAGCHSGSCVLLVANFVLPSGSTSELGMGLADQLSTELSAQQHGIQIVARGRLRDYLKNERIPSKLLQEKSAARWLASELNATAILIGTLEEKQGGLQLTVELLSVPKKGLSWSSEKIELEIPGLGNDLKPAEPFGSVPQSSGPVDGPKVFKANTDGVSNPECLYCPTPSYTDPARSAEFQGTLVLLVTVSAEGNPIDVRVLRGAPFNLDQSAMQTVRSWKLDPAKRRGSPVAAVVPVEVTFHLN